MARLPIFSSEKFSWSGTKGSSTTRRIKASVGPLGRGFYIKSERTGDTRLFLYDSQTMEANEFFDGEYVAFMSPGNDLTVLIGAN